MIPKIGKNLGALLLRLRLRPESSKGNGHQELSTMTESKGKSKLMWERLPVELVFRVPMLDVDTSSVKTKFTSFPEDSAGKCDTIVPLP